ncbi:hypothetical protein H0H93_012407, partial [Arthromyces matolae]
MTSPPLPSFNFPPSPSPHRPMALTRSTPASLSSGTPATSSPKPLSGSPLLPTATSQFEEDRDDIGGCGSEEAEIHHAVGDDKVEEVGKEVEVKPTENLKYCMEIIFFKIGQTFFRIPAHFFRTCTNFFDEHLNEAAHNGKVIIERDDVNISDFRALFKFLYPISLTRTLTDDEWTSVLKVSTKWEMVDIRRMAIEHLDSTSIPLVDRI